jgi:hypothetical protein
MDNCLTDPANRYFMYRYETYYKLSHDLKYELKSVNRPKPNGKFLWMRPSLAIHNMVREPKKEKGFKHWLKYKLGKPPVLASEVSPENVSSLMRNRFFNRGFFNVHIEYEGDTLQKKFQINYFVTSGKQFLIDSVQYNDGQTGLEKSIQSAASTSSIISGKPYILENLKSERERVEFLVKDSGYYYFDKDFLIYKADTLKRPKHVNLELGLKPNIPPLVNQKVYLNKIYVLDDYSVENYNPDTTEYRGYYYISNRHVFRPDIITDRIHLRPNQETLKNHKPVIQPGDLSICKYGFQGRFSLQYPECICLCHTHEKKCTDS